MSRNDRYRRYLEAAAALGEMTRARAEELVKELKGGGDAQRAQAQQWLDELVERGRDAAGDLVDVVRTEVSRQLQALGLDPEDLARQAAEAMRRTAEAGRRVVHDVAPGAGARTARPHAGSGAPTTAKGAPAAGKAPAGAAKAAAAKKAAATKKAGATKAGGTKKAAPTKRSAAKAAAAKKAAGARKSPANGASARSTAAGGSPTGTTDAR